MKKFFLKLQSGQSLVEILLVIGLSAVLLPALLVGLVASREGKVQQSQRTQALYLLNETVDAVRSVREKGWSYIEAVPIGVPYHPEISSPTWSLVAGEYTDLVTGFKTKLVINNVNRGVCPGPDCGEIVTVGGSLDPSTKKVVVTISWGLPYLSSISDTLYMTRYLENDSHVETTEADFNGGTVTGTTVTNTLGGEVTLGAGGHGNWCSPNLSISALDLPKSGVANAVTAIEGRAFAGTGDNASGESFVNISIPNTSSPSASILGTFSNYKTNDVFGDENYGYIATDTNSKEIVVINLASSPYVETGYFDAPGVTNANSVFIVGNTGYMTQNNMLRNFDLTNCRTTSAVDSCPSIDPNGTSISATGTSVVVSGTYAFVSIAGHARELEIFDISNPANIVRIGWADVNGEAATDVFMNATASRAYIVTNASSTLPEFFIIDTTNKTCSDCSDIGRYDAGTSTNLKAVEVVPGNRAIIIGEGGEEYQVLNISDETTPVKCGGMQINSGVKDSASVLETDGDAYSYIVTGDASAEFRIIEGGPGGQYASSGEFESNTFDPGYQTAFNRFDVSVDRPVNSDIKFHVAVEDDISGSCTGVGFTFVGPDATSGTFFDTTQTAGTTIFNYSIPGSINPGRCFRYKSYFSTSDFTSTPIFYDMTLNFSP